MDKRQCVVAGVLLALMAGFSVPAGAREPARATPLERCTEVTSHKLYTRADADFESVLARLDVELGTGPRHAKGIEPKRIPARPMSFSVTLETRQCQSIPAGPGAWAPELMRDLGLPLRVERRVLLWFDPIGGVAPFEEPNFPIYIWDCGDNISFYGFPHQTGVNGIKVAIHTVGQACTPDNIDRTLHEADVAHLQSLLASRIPALTGPMLDYATCMYTLTPDEHFVIATHPQHPQVVLASPCSGHGFKFAPVIGEILADLAEHGRTDHDINLFALRF